MSSLVPNAIILNRFRLNNSLSGNSSAGHQTWSVTDTQTGQQLIARIHDDGHIDWFNDNRLTSGVKVTDSPATAVRDSSRSQPNHRTMSSPWMDYSADPRFPAAGPVKGRGRGWVILVMILAGAAVAGYFNQEVVLETYNLWTRHKADSLAVQSNTTVADSRTEAFPSWKPEAVPEVTPSKTIDVDSTAIAVGGAPDDSWKLRDLARQKMRLLVEMDPRSNPVEYKPIFASAREHFQKLSESNQALRDSIHIIAADRASQSYRNYKHKDDLNEKISALEWFRIVQTIKPSAATTGRINELQGVVRKIVPTKKQPYFQPDPELNR